VTGFEEWDQSARAQHLEKKLGRRRAFHRFTLSEVRYCSVCNIDAQTITRLDELMDAGYFENRQADFMTVSVEGPRKSLSEDGTDTGGFDRLCCDGAAGGTPEVTSSNNDVALLDPLWKFRIQRFENVLCHLGETLPDDVSGSDLVCGNVVTEFPAVPFEYHGRDFTSPVNCTGLGGTF
jgi:hypothetical protein